MGLSSKNVSYLPKVNEKEYVLKLKILVYYVFCLMILIFLLQFWVQRVYEFSLITKSHTKFDESKKFSHIKKIPYYIILLYPSFTVI